MDVFTWKTKSTQLSARPLILHLVYLNTSLICLHQLTRCKDRKFFLGVPPNSSGIFHYCTELSTQSHKNQPQATSNKSSICELKVTHLNTLLHLSHHLCKSSKSMQCSNAIIKKKKIYQCGALHLHTGTCPRRAALRPTAECERRCTWTTRSCTGWAPASASLSDGRPQRKPAGAERTESPRRAGSPPVETTCKDSQQRKNRLLCLCLIWLSDYLILVAWSPPQGIRLLAYQHEWQRQRPKEL